MTIATDADDAQGVVDGDQDVPAAPAEERVERSRVGRDRHRGGAKA